MKERIKLKLQKLKQFNDKACLPQINFFSVALILMKNFSRQINFNLKENEKASSHLYFEVEGVRFFMNYSYAGIQLSHYFDNKPGQIFSIDQMIGDELPPPKEGGFLKRKAQRNFRHSFLVGVAFKVFRAFAFSRFSR